MLSIKRLSKKFGRQSLNEIKPAPPCSTVDHTIPLTSSPVTSTSFNPHITPLDVERPTVPAPLMHDHASSSDSDNDEEEERDWSTSTQTKASPVLSVIKKKHLTSKLKIERVSSAEKRKYRQYKYLTGSSSSGSSSDDEVKEAFEDHTHQRYSFLPLTSQTFSWNSLKETKQGYPHTWTADPICSCRPVKVVPVGHRKPKFFAQMSTNYAERPRLDFNKMQHSKRLVMVRRPIVLRNNSKIHSIQRPPSLEVSLDISDHSFQPVLTQT